MSHEKHKAHHFSAKEKKLAKKLDHLRIKHAWKTLPWKERPKQYSNEHSHRWNLHEEVLNSVTHGIGVFLGILALILMLVNATRHHSVWGEVSGAIFGSSLIVAYISSMIYHAVLYPPMKRIFRILDHSCIFILIAGTYTPFCLVTLHGTLGWTVFAVVWSCALVGIGLKIFFVDRFQVLSTIIYLVMGWFVVLLSMQLIDHLPLVAVLWLAAGGLLYTGGVVFFVLERIPFFHTLWHLFVLAGSASHFIAVWLYVMPVVPAMQITRMIH